MGPASDFDCDLSSSAHQDRLNGAHPRAAPDAADGLRSYCVQADGVRVGELPSVRVGQRVYGRSGEG